MSKDKKEKILAYWLITVFLLIITGLSAELYVDSEIIDHYNIPQHLQEELNSRLGALVILSVMGGLISGIIFKECKKCKKK